MSQPARLPVLAALLALAALPARAATPREQLHALRQEIAALQVDRALNLTQAQARALLPVLEEGAVRARDARAAREVAAPGLVAVLTTARDELQATGAVSDATRQALVALRAPRAARAPEAHALRARVQAILSPEQRQALRTVPLWIGPGPGGAPGVGGSGTGIAAPEAGAATPREGRGPGRRGLVARVLVSDPFLALLRARAG
jgi:hypothetical protein